MEHFRLEAKIKVVKIAAAVNARQTVAAGFRLKSLEGFGILLLCIVEAGQIAEYRVAVREVSGKLSGRVLIDNALGRVGGILCDAAHFNGAGVEQRAMRGNVRAFDGLVCTYLVKP